MSSSATIITLYYVTSLKKRLQWNYLVTDYWLKTAENVVWQNINSFEVSHSVSFCNYKSIVTWPVCGVFTVLKEKKKTKVSMIALTFSVALHFSIKCQSRDKSTAVFVVSKTAVQRKTTTVRRQLIQKKWFVTSSQRKSASVTWGRRRPHRV